MIPIWQGYASDPMLILVILSAAKELTERSDKGRGAGARSFAAKDDRKARLWMPSQPKDGADDRHGRDARVLRCGDGQRRPPPRPRRLRAGAGLQRRRRRPQARDPIEAIRLRAARLYAVRRGKVVAESPAQTARLHLPGPPDSTSFTP